MDDRTKELAMKYKGRMSERIKRSEKFPIKLPDSQEQMAAMLLGSYGAVVESRDMDLMLDDATVSKVEKVVKDTGLYLRMRQERGFKLIIR